MFKGYKLDKISLGTAYNDYLQIGKELYQSYERNVHNTLDSFFLNNKTLDGNEIISSWFPQINCHIFLSHSHNDKDEVLAIAGWLKINFDLNSFIDSAIWDYGNDLVQIIDNKYSWLDQSTRLYDYKKVLFSTSHVHMMLSTALSFMIDKTECLIFYDTPNSVQTFDSINRTESPWIYSEIAFTEIVRKNTPKRLNKISESFSPFMGAVDHFEKALNISYNINFNHLKSIDFKILNEWYKYHSLYKNEKALDKLYELTFPINE